MVLIVWREEYCTGIKVVDYEHEKLFEQINALYVSIDTSVDKQHLLDSLGDIFGSISAHFELEEQMMRKHRYAHFKEHEADHQRLLKDINGITENFKKLNELDKSLFEQKLADWFQSHYRTHDSRLHKLIHLSPHDRGDETTMRVLVRNAKNKLLH